MNSITSINTLTGNERASLYLFQDSNIFTKMSSFRLSIAAKILALFNAQLTLKRKKENSLRNCSLNRV